MPDAWECPGCARFVKANKVLRTNWLTEDLVSEPNATCSRCGAVQMLLEGFI